MLLWLPLALIVVSNSSPRKTVLLVLVGGTLVLPERVVFDLPVLKLDKHIIAAGSALLACWIKHPQVFKRPLPTRMVSTALVLIAFNSVLTSWTNPEALTGAQNVRPALTWYDALCTFSIEAAHTILPFYLGHAVFRTNDDLQALLRALCIAALLYAPFVLLEARLSPFLHIRLYGFFQHEWQQMKRAGGFRAIMLMAHGLAVALFLSQALIATAAFARFKKAMLPIPAGLVFVILAIALISCKSLGALIYAVFLVPLVAFTGLGLQLRTAQVLAAIVIMFPLLRISNWVPTEWIMAQFEGIAPDRAGSLGFRLMNEDLLLENWREKPWFGWGGWLRSHVFDPETNKDLTVVDGAWIGALGQRGLLGFSVLFGLLLLPVFSAGKAAKRLGLVGDDARTLVTLAVLVAVGGLDLIPNSLFHWLPLFVAGALASTSATVIHEHPRPR